jgi:glycosyltransferase involved in cell wall biosynthesis
MQLTFVAHSTRRPSGGLRAIYEFANAMARRGHAVHLVHRPNITMRAGFATRLGDLEWASFDPRLTHTFAGFEAPPTATGSPDFDELVFRDAMRSRIVGADVDFEAFPTGDFVFWYHPELPADRGLPLIFVQGDLVGDARQRARMRRPCPKLCTATWLAELGRAAGVPEDELFHLPYGIDHRQFRVVAPIDGRPRRVSMLYHEHRKKGARFGIEALARVVERVSDAEVVLFGVSDPVHALPPRTEFRTNPSQAALVEEVYNRSSVFVQPSTREGFGFTPVEAMGCGCAVVSTANGGSADYAFDGDTALVVPPRKPDAMADAIERLLLDDELRVAIARRGNEFVRRQFDWDTSAARLESFLERYGAAPEQFGAGRREVA